MRTSGVSIAAGEIARRTEPKLPCPSDHSVGRENGLGHARTMVSVKTAGIAMRVGIYRMTSPTTRAISYVALVVVGCPSTCIAKSNPPGMGGGGEKKTGLSPSGNIRQGSTDDHAHRVIEIRLAAISSSRLTMEYFRVRVSAIRRFPKLD